MKIKTKPKQLEDGREEALVEITNVEVKALLTSTRYYVQGHREHLNEDTAREMAEAEVDLEEILSILHGRKPYVNE